MSHIDWSELHVQVQPLAHQLYEAMSLREWEQAERIAHELTEVAFDIQRECIKQMVRSGQGFTKNYMYEA